MTDAVDDTQRVCGWPVGTNGQVTITLSYPFPAEYVYPGKNAKHAPGTEPLLHAVKVRRVKTADIKAVNTEPSDFKRGVHLAMLVTGLAEDDFDKLDVVDLHELMEVVSQLQRKSTK